MAAQNPQTTQHRLRLGDSARLDRVEDKSVHLIVTSPPYPMIAMWDDTLAERDGRIQEALQSGDGRTAFRRMHDALQPVWKECVRVLAPGGFMCVNIGDATRTLDGDFRLYANHAELLHRFSALGLSALPLILWRKSTNSPTKFMGSGTLPAGAYVTLEHEYILVMRKGRKRGFATQNKSVRRESAMFWEERNRWYSDLWDLGDVGGARQALPDPGARSRSGAFPFELPYRLLSMFSIKGDRVLDPFLGTGTTMAAAIATQRNSIGVEREEALLPVIEQTLAEAPGIGNRRNQERLQAHREFVRHHTEGGRRELSHWNEPHAVPVVSGQETELRLSRVAGLPQTAEREWEARYEPLREEILGPLFDV